MKSVFLSHSSKDDGIVRQIRQALESLGIEVWADSERLSGGDLLAPTIQAEIEKADYFVVLVSFNALNSEWVQREIKHAQSVGKAGYKVIPVVRPGIGTPMLRLLFGEEPVWIPLGEGPAAVSDAVHDILTAIGEQIPTEAVRRVVAKNPPLADLVLSLKDPAVEELDGKRRATAVAELIYIPADGTPRVESERYRFTSPLGPIEAEEIAWYLERYVNWPTGVFEDRARRVEKALPEWGRLLYDSVNAAAARKALEAWKGIHDVERSFTVRVDKNLIAGTSAKKQMEANEAATLLLSLPWELIHDDKGYLFQGKRPVRVRRSLPNRDGHKALTTEPPIRVLLVSPRPEDDSAAYIDHRSSARPLVEALSRLGDLAQFHLLDPPTFPALERELVRAAEAGEPYHVVHFDGHGVYDRKHGLGMLCFEDPADAEKLDERRSQLIDADEIARIVREHRIPLFFLEACQTAKAATDPSASVAGRLLESGVASVAAMSHSVLVETARRFIAEFYAELLNGKRVGQAMLAGQRALKADTFRGKTFTGELRLEDWFVPVLFQEEKDPQLIAEVPAQRVESAMERRKDFALGELPDEPAHQFLGRSRDLLKAERILSRQAYLVVQGSGGEGKTTFAAELTRWLVATRRFARAAFASVEQVTEARQVLFSLGTQLVPNLESRAGTDDRLARQFVEKAIGEHPTVLVIDNMESILASSAGAGEAVGEILELCAALGKVGKTRIVFTTREALPEPFAKNVLPIGRLDNDTAIRLLSSVLQNPPASGESEHDLENLVDAVGGHARSLVLIGREVGAVGVRHAVKNLREVMSAIEAKHPGERENSLFASAELSLRRLPADIRQLIRPLAVFHGGGGLGAIGLALQLESQRLLEVARALADVGLAEFVEPGFLRFDPALIGGGITSEERDAATTAWGEAVAAEMQFLYGQQFKDSHLANNLTLLELPNLLAALEHFSETESPERVVDLSTYLEPLVASLDRPRVLARIVEIRTAAGRRLSGWSRSQCLLAGTSVERLIDQGRYADASRAAQALYSRCAAAGESAYEGAAYDLATAQRRLGLALERSGDAEAALPHCLEAHKRFELLNATRMAGVALTEAADCLKDLGRYDEAAEAYLLGIKSAEELKDSRKVAVDKSQLATTRLLQHDYPGALRLYAEAREVFERLNEPAAVGRLWHQVATVYQRARNYEAAEQAYQTALAIKVRTGDRAGQATTLGELANLSAYMGHVEEAVRFYRQTIEIFAVAGDLQNEGRSRSNVAGELIKLGRYDEARIEIERAIECKKPFGHAAQPWKALNILSNLETAVGNQAAALAARDQAIAAYLAYRRAGGAPQIDPTKLIARVQQDPTAARAALADPEIPYGAAAEITLALEDLKS